MTRTYPPFIPGMHRDGSYRLPKGNRWLCPLCGRDVAKSVPSHVHNADYHPHLLAIQG